MATRIDFDKSITNDRLYWKRDFYGKLDLFYNWFYWIIWMQLLLVVPLNFMIKEFSEGNYVNIATIFLFGMFSIGLLALYGIFVIFRLRRVRGITPEVNRQVLTNILSREFDNVDLTTASSNIQIVKRPMGNFTFGHRVTVLFDDRDVLMNIVTLGKWDLLSIFHSAFNDDKVQAILRVFQEEIKNAPQQKL